MSYFYFVLVSTKWVQLNSWYYRDELLNIPLSRYLEVVYSFSVSLSVYLILASSRSKHIAALFCFFCFFFNKIEQKQYFLLVFILTLIINNLTQKVGCDESKHGIFSHTLDILVDFWCVGGLLSGYDTYDVFYCAFCNLLFFGMLMYFSHVHDHVTY